MLEPKESLLGLSASADGGQEQVNEHKAVSTVDAVVLAKLKELGALRVRQGSKSGLSIEDTTDSLYGLVACLHVTVAIFLDEVVIELVMRDIHSLLETYLKRMTQFFGEFTVEHAVMRHHSSISA